MRKLAGASFRFGQWPRGRSACFYGATKLRAERPSFRWNRSTSGYADVIDRVPLPPDLRRFMGAPEKRADHAARNWLGDRGRCVRWMYSVRWPAHVDRHRHRDGVPPPPPVGLCGLANLICPAICRHHILRNRGRAPASKGLVAAALARRRGAPRRGLNGRLDTRSRLARKRPRCGPGLCRLRWSTRLANLRPATVEPQQAGPVKAASRRKPGC